MDKQFSESEKDRIAGKSQEIPTPLQLLVEKKEALMTELLTADTKQRNRIKKAIPDYNTAISLLNNGQPKIV